MPPVMTDRSTEPGGIYIHIPFCVQKCVYCDFYSRTDLDLIPGFLKALLRETTLGRHPADAVWDSIYFGGGTPTVLGPEPIEAILECLRRRYVLRAEAEVTLEANPGTVNRKDLDAYRRAGVNRLNIGVQSFQDANLRFLGRIHGAAEAVTAMKQARKAGFENIGMDLIYGLPNQSPEAWRSDLETAVAWAPEHLSCYMLSYETGTPLDRLRRKGRIEPLPDRKVGDLFHLTLDLLDFHGYSQYEISNFARSKRLQSRHNRKYWNGAPYLGMGPSAHSFFPPETRCWNVSDTETYIRKVSGDISPVEGEERLDSEQRMMEAFYLELRQNDGIEISEFERRFGGDFRSRFTSLLAELSEKSLLTMDENRCALTRRGMMVLDAIVSRFIDAF